MVRTPKAFHMRRKDKEITDLEEIERIMKEAKVCHLGLIDDDEPYVVPVNFGYMKNHIYFHSALEGRKVSIIKKNNRVCFNIVSDIEVIDVPNSCEARVVKYKSVTGVGVANIVEDDEEKILGLKRIMQQNLLHEYDFPLERLDSTLVLRIDIHDVKGKQST
ncbi:MAG: pyridoxamine 5'-phosphate oxidase family protein [Chloroflexota bacterium]